MEAQILSAYVAGRIRAGANKETIKGELLSVGWTDEEAEAGYREGVLALGAPVPTTKNRSTISRQSSTVDVVLNFFSFILLGISASALGMLFFAVIGLTFPDPLDLAGQYARNEAMNAIHYSIAALLISFPLYFLAMRLWFRRFREDEGRIESRLSRWLTYLVLLVTAVILVGDAITIIFTLLQGEISLRFFLKALTILGIAGSIFGFYYFERKKIQYRADIPRAFFLYFGRGITMLISIGVILGFIVGGSPSTQRQSTFDQTRSEHLTNLSDCIEEYARNLGALPTSLEDLRQSSQFSYCATWMQDPETQAMYPYRVVTPSRIMGASQVGDFELCATFALPSEGLASDYAGSATVWNEHAQGKSCDTVSAQLVSPISKPGIR